MKPKNIENHVVNFFYNIFSFGCNGKQILISIEEKYKEFIVSYGYFVLNIQSCI